MLGRSHLSVEEIALYVHSSMEPATRDELASHIEMCESCRAEIGAAVRAAREERSPGQALPEDDEINVGTRIGRYVVVGWLGAGGMGRVYSANDPELDRKIALKLLRAAPSVADAESFARLVREAQLTARLSHPNVVAVYDVGSFGSQVFVAMELVDGETLRTWHRTEPRDWRAVVDVLRQAGTGIAAAHAAGLIHRDIKPDNILVGRDGRVRVSDFGLARAVAEATDRASDPAIAAGDPVLGDGSRLTHTGGVLGTPAYMAPEQLRGERADARSDQFSFCVALYEALHGERPFAGTTLEELGTAIATRRVTTPPRDAVPGWLRKVVLRGLSDDPAERYPSMTSMLAALGNDPRIRVRRVAAASVAVVAIAGGLVWARSTAEAPARLCVDSRARLAPTWNPERRRAIQTAITANKRPFAEGASQGVERGLNRYAESWIAAHTEACESARVRGDQSEQLLDRRNLCLEERRAALDSTVELLAHADAALVERSVRLVADLPDLAACSDTKSLLALVALPVEPARRVELERLRGQLGAARVFQRGARYPEARKAVSELEPQAVALGYAPLTAEVHELSGTIADEQRETKTALAELDRAVLTAEAGGDDVTKARSLIASARIRAMANVEPERVDALFAQARATLARLGPSPAVELRLALALGGIAFLQGKFAEALPHYETALVVAKKQFGPDDLRVADVNQQLAQVFERLGEYDRGVTHVASALTVFERELGPNHPKVAAALGVRSQLLYDLARYDEALVSVQRSYEILVSVFGEDHVATWPALSDTARTLQAQTKFADALAIYQRARELVDRGYGPDHVNAVLARLNVASALFEVGREEEAIAAFRDTIERANKAAGPDSIFAANANNGLAQAARRKHPKVALHAGREALRMFRALEGEEHPDVGRAHDTLGKIQLELGQRDEAIRSFTAALANRAAAMGEDHPDTAETRFSLAELIYNGGDRVRGRALAEAARAGFVATDPANAKTIATWLSEHPP